MIVVHVNKSWPFVQEGRMDEAEAVLVTGQSRRTSWAEYGDLAPAGGLRQHRRGGLRHRGADTRDEDKKVTFIGNKSQAWAYLVADPTPARIGAARGMPGRCAYVDTAIVTGGDVSVESTHEGRRVVVDGFTFVVGADLNATVIVPAGRAVTVRVA